MNLPTIHIDKNLSEVVFNGVTVWFSYKTPVAFQVYEQKIVVHQNDWSTTTGRHLNQIDRGDKKSRVSSEDFHRLWKEQTR